jgi:hypothetical protein
LTFAEGKAKYLIGTPKRIISIAPVLLFIASVVWYAFAPSSNRGETPEHSDSTSEISIRSP